MLKTASSVVLASLKTSTYRKKYASAFRSLRPSGTAVLSILNPKKCFMTMSLVVAMSVAACTYGYQARDYWGIGYSEVEIEPNVYFVEYTGSDQSMAEVVGFWHRRAKELCQAKQKQGYEILRSQTDSGGQTGVIVPLPGAGYVSGSTDYPRHTGYIRCTDVPTTLFPAQSR